MPQGAIAAMPAASYLENLNPEQRSAVEHGVAGAGANVAGPLLVIAGAGSGKTNTLAHRVAHLIVNGADPGRILLLTFSRRAAAEMVRRAERIIAAALGPAGPNTRLGWSGTFHAIGARLLRTHAHAIGLDPSFTIHDREDSADLMNLVRHERSLSEKDRRFPLKATCLAIYSRASTPESRWRPSCSSSFRGARNGRTSLATCSRPMSLPSSASMCSTTTICSSTGAS